VTIVVDASLVTVLVSGDPRRSLVDTLIRGWIQRGEDLHAPAHFRESGSQTPGRCC